MNKQVLDKLKVERERGITGLCALIASVIDDSQLISEGSDSQVKLPLLGSHRMSLYIPPA